MFSLAIAISPPHECRRTLRYARTRIRMMVRVPALVLQGVALPKLSPGCFLTSQRVVYVLGAALSRKSSKPG